MKLFIGIVVTAVATYALIMWVLPIIVRVTE